MPRSPQSSGGSRARAKARVGSLGPPPLLAGPRLRALPRAAGRALSRAVAGSAMRWGAEPLSAPSRAAKAPASRAR
eukprot:4301454-Alexandrium_andersonii.AAC.1